jgi:hypothetical protein
VLVHLTLKFVIYGMGNILVCVYWQRFVGAQKADFSKGLTPDAFDKFKTDHRTCFIKFYKYSIYFSTKIQQVNYFQNEYSSFYVSKVFAYNSFN